MITAKLNAQTVIKNIQNTVRLTGDFRPFLRLITGKKDDRREWTIIGGTLKNFMTQSGPDGKKWPDLSPKYAEQKEKIYGKKPMLVASGKMFESLVGFGDGNVNILSTSKLVYGTQIDYFQYHQSGTKNIPQRRSLGWSDVQIKEITNLLKAYVRDAWSGVKEPVFK